LTIVGRWALKHPAKEEQAHKGLGYWRKACFHGAYQVMFFARCRRSPHHTPSAISLVEACSSLARCFSVGRGMGESWPLVWMATSFHMRRMDYSLKPKLCEVCPIST
jgi:hypothetical protein